MSNTVKNIIARITLSLIIIAPTSFGISNAYAATYIYGPMKLYNETPDVLYDTPLELAYAACARLVTISPAVYGGCIPESVHNPAYEANLYSSYVYLWFPNFYGPNWGSYGTATIRTTCPYKGGEVVVPFCRYDTTNYLPDKNYGGCDTCAGNPINTGTGNKYQIEHDLSNTVSTPWRATRYYNSQKAVSGKLGKGWSMFGSLRYANSDVVILTRPDSKVYTFRAPDGIWRTDLDVQFRLSQIKDSTGKIMGWKVVTPDDEIETYNAEGLFISYQTRAGTGYSIVWNFNGNSTLSDTWGRTYLIKFANDKLESIADPAGGVTHYTQDSGNRLVKVTYPDNKERHYHYEDSRFTDYLTGITDENGVRYATWKYDEQGRAYSSEHGTGIDKYQITFGNASSTIANPLGSSCMTNFTTVLGVIKSAGQAQQGSSGCGPAASSITYDINGNVSSRTNFNGIQTTYTYDLTRNLETKRVEASGTLQARTITTEWHPTYRLPARIAEPLKIITNTYDPNGNLLSKSVQATTDANGSQGLAATPVGAPRGWTYTYNQYGQVLTADGPLTGDTDKTTYTYDGMGNLATITNARGHVTTLSNYDLNGRVGRITDPNGLVTDLAYSPRGWLTSKSVSSNGPSETTTFDYDGVGQMTQVTLPDNSSIHYTYDDAHRLTDISDSLGNSIHYTLDNMGNRTSEQVKDPSGTLSKQVTRIFDALNRLQQVTGAIQ